MKTLDCRKWQCPKPVVEARKALLAEPGVPFTILLADEIARENVSRLATSLGYAVSEAASGDGFTLGLTPGPSSEQKGATAAAEGKTVVFIASDTMGSGDDELGHILLKNFIITLNELDLPPDAIVFVNAGVKLTTEGSDALEALEQLACNGTDIASCGLCLDFFDLKEKLAVGRSTNMLDIVEHLAQAGRVIRP